MSNSRSRIAKRLVDLTVASIALVLLAPILLLVAVLVTLHLHFPILYHQQRAGLGGRPFAMIKFRTMTQSQDTGGQPLADVDRLTSLGRFLRTTSLDEMPELLNVLRGDMSLVGPRPLLVQYLERYTPAQMRRHEVLPGITGWAQVKGRNALTWEERFSLDLWYVDNCSLWLDMKILGLTVLSILRREGISRPGYATMPEFRGSDDKSKTEGAM
jgi:sugar transferase EpsL